jgi:hypothetical protein
MAKRSKRDPLKPLLKMLRVYLRPEDLGLDHHQFLATVVQRIQADKKAYKRLRTNIRYHNEQARNNPVMP